MAKSLVSCFFDSRCSNDVYPEMSIEILNLESMPVAKIRTNYCSVRAVLYCDTETPLLALREWYAEQGL